MGVSVYLAFPEAYMGSCRYIVMKVRVCFYLKHCQEFLTKISLPGSFDFSAVHFIQNTGGFLLQADVYPANFKAVSLTSNKTLKTFHQVCPNVK